MSPGAEPALFQWAAERQHQLGSRLEFCDAIGEAVARGRGYAAGKLGVTERALLYHPVLLAGECDSRRITAFERSLAFKAGRQSGVFPAESQFLRRFSRWYAEHFRQLDCIGLMPHALQMTSGLMGFHRFEARLVHYTSQEPDRSSPADDRLCYLPHFRDKRVLLVCPFAELLRSRADRTTFELVWRKTGKRWFDPAAVEAVEFPYGFDSATHARYETVIDLFDEIVGRTQEHEFDVALIAAGVLGIPLAAETKRLGKVAISLGGSLQVLFGVNGERWRGRASWQRDYFNDTWVDIPHRYVPDSSATSENYW